jgi:hydantoinase/carbamoylase family amidase
MSRASPGSGPQAVAAPKFGERVMALADRLAAWSETPDGLTCTFLSPAHRAVARELAVLMANAGLAAEIDTVANVVGRYRSSNPSARTVIVASHYDTVCNAGKYDGRLGILVPLVVVEYFARTGERLPFNLELIAFSEEEGMRFSTAYIGSSAIAGRFDPQLLNRRDAKGTSLAEALRDAGYDPGLIPKLARRGSDLAAYLEVHIEQGPVLLDADVPVGVVTSIAGNTRYAVTIDGKAGHAGTVPMALRHDALAAGAEIVLLVERRCHEPGLTGTVGRLTIADGATNLIPGRCDLTIDIRSADDSLRAKATTDILAEVDQIAARRGVTIAAKEHLNVPAVACSPRLQNIISAAIGRAGLPVLKLPSGAGHDSVMFSGLADMAMMFVRSGNGGISHSPRETITAADADVAAHILLDVLRNLGST